MSGDSGFVAELYAAAEQLADDHPRAAAALFAMASETLPVGTVRERRGILKALRRAAYSQLSNDAAAKLIALEWRGWTAPNDPPLAGSKESYFASLAVLGISPIGQRQIYTDLTS